MPAVGDTHLFYNVRTKSKEQAKITSLKTMKNGAKMAEAKGRDGTKMTAFVKG